jgi:DNA-directed RNA polymerase
MSFMTPNRHAADYNQSENICKLPPPRWESRSIFEGAQCSKLRNGSKSLACEHAAPLVNLVDSDKPHDVYAALIERTFELFDDSPEALFWRELFVDPRKARKVVKPLGVSFAYGSKSRGNICDPEFSKAS